MKSLIAAAVMAAAIGGAPAVARAQDGRGRGPAPAPVPHNLQVLPRDTSPQDVVALMQTFTRGLGVQCTYCHSQQAPVQLSVEELQAQQAAAAQAGGRARGRGRGGPQIDFAADDKRTKKTARVMMAMVNDINARLATAVHKPAADITRVQCATCHRGVTNPQMLSDLLRKTMLGKGEVAAVVQYRELRQAYLTTGAYDFREPILLDLARESLKTQKPDDALAWLQLNVEFFPGSVPSYIELSKAHLAKRDRDAAVADLTRALAIDPANADATRQLRLIKK